MYRRPRNWMPGLLPGRTVPSGEAAMAALNFGEVYPDGIFAEICVRFRGPLSLIEQHAISTQAEAYLRNRPEQGPQLVVHQESLEDRAEVISFQGLTTMWTFQYWLDRSLSESPLDLDFSWQEQSIGEKFSFSRAELSEALGNSIKLWEPGANEAVGL